MDYFSLSFFFFFTANCSSCVMAKLQTCILGEKRWLLHKDYCCVHVRNLDRTSSTGRCTMKHSKIALQSFSDMLVLWLKGRKGMVGHGLSFCEWMTIIRRITKKDIDPQRTTSNGFGHYRSKYVHLFEC